MPAAPPALQVLDVESATAAQAAHIFGSEQLSAKYPLPQFVEVTQFPLLRKYSDVSL